MKIKRNVTFQATNHYQKMSHVSHKSSSGFLLCDYIVACHYNFLVFVIVFTHVKAKRDSFFLPYFFLIITYILWHTY
jgi:hypothetical protein